MKRLHDTLTGALAAAIAAIALVAPPASAEWLPDGRPLAATLDLQIQHQITNGDDGEAIAVWVDFRNSAQGDLHASKIDRFGNPLWGESGTPVYEAAGEERIPVLVSDGAGGAIVAWQVWNVSHYDLRVGRIGSDGSTLWIPGGVPVCTMPGDQVATRIVADGAGGAIIVWRDERNGIPDPDIYAQRVNALGVPQWTADGVPVCSNDAFQEAPELVPDGRGGAIIVWEDQRNEISRDLYVQRIDATGTARWGTDGMVLCDEPGIQQFPSIISDGADGAIISWHDFRNMSNLDIYAARVEADGNLPWTPGGIRACASPFPQTYPVLASDGAGGAIIAWNDQRNFATAGWDVYANRILSDGTPVWGAGGVPVCAASRDQTNPVIVSDGVGGAVVAWQDLRPASHWDLYCARLSPSGALSWTGSGAPISRADKNQLEPGLVLDGKGGVLAVWQDARGHDTDIFAQRIDLRYGYWGHPEPELAAVADVPLDQGGRVRLDWKASGRDALHQQTISHYTIWRATDETTAKRAGGRTATLDEVDRNATGPVYRFEKGAGGADYYWELVGTHDAAYMPAYSYTAPTRYDGAGANTNLHHFQVVAHAYESRYLNWPSEPVSGRSIDNLPPGRPYFAERVKTGKGNESNSESNERALAWRFDDEAGDLLQFRVYGSEASGFEAGDATFLGVAADTFWIAGQDAAGAAARFYRVSAVDVNGNEGPVSDEVYYSPSTGVPGAAPSVRLLANRPNPFNPTTTIAYHVDAREARTVRLAIYDMAGRLVRTLVDGPRSPGPHEVVWDGTDDAGRAAGSGVYAYRVEIDGASETRRMTMVR